MASRQHDSARSRPPEQNQPPQETTGPPPVARWVISGLVLAHFFAIFTAVTSAGNANFPAPYIARKLIRLTRPYLQFVFLNNPYRFYAPNPSSANIFWFRIRYGDGVVRWVEVPRRSEFAARMPYQRHLSVTLIFDQMALPMPSSEDPNQRALVPEGKIVLASYIRHVARRFGRKNADGTPVPIEDIQFYNVWHGVLEPWMVKRGMGINELPLFAPYYLGTYTADGARVDSVPILNGHEVWLQQTRSISELVANMLASDIYPLFREKPEADRMDLLEEIGAPTPVQELLLKFPELANPDLPETDLRERIERYVLQGQQAAAG